MVATSLDLSQIKTDALSSASTFRTLIDLGSEDSPTFKTLVISDGSASASAIDIAQTWNNGVTKFTAFKMDITDTASNAGSLLMDLQVGGSSIFRVTKAGAASADSISLTSGVISGDSTSIKIASGTSTPLQVDYIKAKFFFIGGTMNKLYSIVVKLRGRLRDFTQ